MTGLVVAIVGLGVGLVLTGGGLINNSLEAPRYWTYVIAGGLSLAAGSAIAIGVLAALGHRL